MSRRILILTAGFGNGHNVAARNTALALRKLEPTIETVVSDIFLEAYPLRARLAARAYLMAIHRLPALWSGVYWLLDRTPAAGAHIRIYRAGLRLLDRKLSEFRPETVVSTYPGCNHLLDLWSRGRVARPFRTMTIITDSQSVNSAWHTAHTDDFCVADAGTAAILESRGVPARKIHVTGFPVPLEFASENLPTRPHGPPWKVLFLANGNSHRTWQYARKICGVPGVELTVGSASGGQAAASLRRLPGVVEAGGWLPNLPARMRSSHFFVGKAGGAAVHECLAAGLPMIISQVVPGQEEGNARMVVEAGAGLIADSPASAAQALERAFANGGEIQAAMAAKALSLGKPRASLEIATLILKN
ncbi:MAG: hypothetical protein N2322_02585 [Terrimicrobiaceae bacterium]|nr:hypothetical protein [Terrimicrobiaceae bacterium]